MSKYISKKSVNERRHPFVAKVISQNVGQELTTREVLALLPKLYRKTHPKRIGIELSFLGLKRRNVFLGTILLSVYKMELTPRVLEWLKKKG